MKNKLLLALVFIILPVLLESCCEEVSRYLAEPGEMTFKACNNTTLEEQDTVAFENFTIETDFPDAVVTNELADAAHFSFGASAYATTCEQIVILKPDIKSVTIVADHDYTTSYRAGTDLSRIFVSEIYSEEVATGAIASATNTSNNLKGALKDLFIAKANLFADPLYVYHYALRPIKRPASSGTFVFTMTVTFQDGSVAVASTNPVMIE